MFRHSHHHRRHPGSPRHCLSLLLSPLLLFAAVTTACTARSNPQASSGEKATIQFVNESIDRAEVFVVVPQRTPTRLGLVLAGETRRLDVPVNTIRQAAGFNIQIVARLQGAGNAQPQSGPVLLREGDALRVTLPIAANHLIVSETVPQ